jgi:hypothetical protein
MRALRSPGLRIGVVLGAMALSSAAYAAVIGVPYTFSEFTTALASEVNANFNALVSESNDQHVQIADLESQVASHTASINANTSDVATALAQATTNATTIATNSLSIGANSANISTNASGIAANTASIAGNGVAIATNANDIDALESTFSGVARVGDLLTFSAVNLRVVDGSGGTAGPTNGLGNLIVGYNENGDGVLRTGSHNLIVGIDHEYTGYGGFVAGRRNKIRGNEASVSGGFQNVADGWRSSVSGGFGNQATAEYTSVSGGVGNQATYFFASVSGGSDNIASDLAATVSGGKDNEAAGGYASVSGGQANDATGVGTSINGGTNINIGTGSAGLEVEGGSTPSLTNSGPEAYRLNPPPFTCDSNTRGQIYVAQPNSTLIGGSQSGQDGICYCGLMSGTFRVNCFTP